MVFVHILYAIISAFVRRRVEPPPVPAHLRVTVPGFLIFLGGMITAVVQGMRNAVRGWLTPPQGARMMHNLASEMPGVCVCMCMCVCVCVCVCLHAHVSVCMCVHVRVRVRNVYVYGFVVVVDIFLNP